MAYNAADNCMYYLLFTRIKNTTTTKAAVMANPIIKVIKYSLSSGSYSDVASIWFKDYEGSLSGGYSPNLDSSNVVGWIGPNNSNMFFSWDGYGYVDITQCYGSSIYTYGHFIFNWRTNAVVSFSPSQPFKWHGGNWDGDTESIGYNNRFGFYATGGTSPIEYKMAICIYR